jgi:hypothetical protein
VKHYQIELDDVVIRLESSRMWLLQGVYWLITTLLVLFDGSFAGTDPAVEVVIRDKGTRRKLYKEGPYFGSAAVAAAEEAARVIRVMGVDGYIRRERL